jgi:hypothetical protein
LALGAAGGAQTSLFDAKQTARRERLQNAVKQARQIAGPDAVLRLIPLDTRSRVLERRYDFTTYR